LTWTRTAGQPPWVELVWDERGGPQLRTPKKQGFGSRLIAASADQLGGEVATQHDAAGTETRFRFPLPDKSADPR
jgi:two-component sensor histidine kinase